MRSPSGLPIDRVDALIDGRPVEARGVGARGFADGQLLGRDAPSDDPGARA